MAVDGFEPHDVVLAQAADRAAEHGLHALTLADLSGHLARERLIGEAGPWTGGPSATRWSPMTCR
mgnify:CR=1 FL=1